MKKIVLQKDVRCFELAFPPICPILAKMDAYLAAGEVVLVGDPVTKTYDHKDMLAIPFEWKGTEGFLLHHEVAPSLTAVV